jgi:hypothetical protein
MPATMMIVSPTATSPTTEMFWPMLSRFWDRKNLFD